jgi:hypothetical protein
MKNCFTGLFLALLVSAAATGCSSSPSKPTDGGTAGTGGGSPGVPLTPGATGFVAPDPVIMIQGSWYAYGDGLGPDGMSASSKCVMAGHTAAQCSQITKPTFGSFPQDVPGSMCTEGTVAQIIDIPGMAGMPDYSNIFGGGIGLDLNNPGGDASVKGPYNAIAHGVIGISFDIDTLSGIPLDGLRVEFPTMNTQDYGAAFWGGDLMKSPVKTGHNEIKWADVKGPFYYQVNGVAATPPPFDPTTIISLQFHAIPGTGGASMYHFCISNVMALTQQP